MRTAVGLVILVIIFGGVVVNSSPQMKYTTKYDNINLDTVIRSDRLLRNYVDCLLGRRRCNKEGEVLKEAIPDALQNNCSKCSPRQEEGVRKVLKYLIENKREWYFELEKVYDPQGVFRSRYVEEAKKQGIKF